VYTTVCQPGLFVRLRRETRESAAEAAKRSDLRGGVAY